MTLGRREFLQRLGGALAALGIGDMALTGSGGVYQQALARSSRRLALLVGINQYPDAVWHAGAPLAKEHAIQGAVTDVELQRELLINRFGASPKDILTLVDGEATGQGIIEAIDGHLADQAQPGDTVIFHFSGLGSKIELAGRSVPTGLPTLVPVDGKYPTETDSTVQDLFEATLAESLAALAGTQLITILDAGAAAPQHLASQGNFRVRSRLTSPTVRQDSLPDGLAEELSAQAQFSKPWPGLLLRASKPGAPTLEGSWSGFSAGVFTYALTQQIWSSFPTQRQYWIFHQVERTLKTWIGSSVEPDYQGDPALEKANLLIAGSVPRPAANGVVKAIDTANKSITLWLGGLPAFLLPYCSLGMRLQPLPTLPGLAAVPQNIITIKAMAGLKAKAESENLQTLKPGMPLIEVERRLPRDVALTIALDPTLERIERVDATSALSGLTMITTAPAREQQVDALFGRLRADDKDIESPSPIGSDTADDGTTVQPKYGLFTPDHTLVPGTSITGDEAVKTAVSRLAPFFRNLLAVKILRLTVNSISSQLPLRLTLETSEGDDVIAFEETLRSRQFSKQEMSMPDGEENGVTEAAAGDGSKNLSLRLKNLGQQPLHYFLVAVTDRDRVSLYCPKVEKKSASAQRNTAVGSPLPPGGGKAVPGLPDGALPFQELQSAEIFAIACVEPFHETWKTIQALEIRQASDRFTEVSDPLPVAKAILIDLHSSGAETSAKNISSPDALLMLQASTWATLCLQLPHELV